MVEKYARLAIIGARGMLAKKVVEMTPAGWDIITLSHPQFDLTDASSSLAALRDIRPDVIINCAAYTDVDGAETHEALAYAVNAVGPENLARAAKQINATLVHISSDYVFGGNKMFPYEESDLAGPLSVYGKSKLRGEQAILDSGLERFFILRTSWLYGPGGKNFVETIIRLAQQREELRIVADQFGTPTYTADLAKAIFNLLALQVKWDAGKRPGDPLFGIYHFSNEGECSWYQFASEIVALLKKGNEPVKTERLLPIDSTDYPLPASRPAYTVMSKQKYKRLTGEHIPTWQESLECYIASRNG